MLYNFRSDATPAHLEFLVRVAERYMRRNQEATCLVAHDSRSASAETAWAVCATLSRFLDPLYLGQCSTPSVVFASMRMQCPAVVVTGSHLPWSQVGLKLYERSGLPIDPKVEREIGLECNAPPDCSHAFGSRQPELCQPRALLDYYALLSRLAETARRKDIVVEVGENWVARARAWLPGMAIVGACRTDPYGVQPSTPNAGVMIRVDEDLDKLVWWEGGQELPGQFLLANWLGLRPRGQIVVSFDTTSFVQEHLAGMGHEVLLSPVGDQFVGRMMRLNHAASGGEPNGHIIAGERSLSPDALACALDLTAAGHIDQSWWRSTPESRYCRGVLAPLQQDLPGIAQRLGAVTREMAMSVSVHPELDSIVATAADGRVILRIGRFERAIALQTEGPRAVCVFDAVSAAVSAEPAQRRDAWVG
jgi:phosphomannomutase